MATAGGRKGGKIDFRPSDEDWARFDRIRGHLSPVRPELVDKSEVMRYAIEVADAVLAGRRPGKDRP